MSADNYALIGIYPSTGTWAFPSTLHGVHVGFMSNDDRPSVIPEGSKAFNTHEEAVAYADQLETEYGVRFLCDCHRETVQGSTPKKVQVPEWEKEFLYPATKKTVRQVIAEYADTLDHIYSARTAGVFTWKGLLHEFMEEIAMAEDLPTTGGERL